MHIRKVTETDIPQLYDLMINYIVDFYGRPMPDEGDVKQLIRLIMEHPERGVQFVAEINSKLVGFATMYFSFSTLQVREIVILNDLFVLPEARGHKIGEALFSYCLKYTRDHQFGCMMWETAKDNEVAQALYAKMGGQISTNVFYEIK